MKAELKTEGMTGLMRTVFGCIHLKTEVVSGGYRMSEGRTPFINYNSANFSIFDDAGKLILSFANDTHVKIETHNNGDPIGLHGWRHIAHDLALQLIGKDVIKDIDSKIVRRRSLDRLSETVMDHLNKLVHISKND